jgi:tRNA(fMet)-specific endonuclease VapC
VTYLLDTDHTTLLLRRTGVAHATLRDRLDAHPESEFGMSIVSFHEQLMGANALIARHRRAEILRGYEFISELLNLYCPAQIVPFDPPAQAEFERLRNQRIRIPTMDLRIASIAIANRLTLLTRNTNDFSKVPGLQFDDRTTP